MESLVNQCGYDDCLFLADAPEYLGCIVRTLVLCDPVLDLSCGHKYCNVCLERLKDQALNEVPYLYVRLVAKLWIWPVFILMWQ